MRARRESARALCPFAEVIVEPFGDIWLRDTGPIVLGSGKQRRAQGFGFNGWGGKYDLDGDQDIGERLAKRAGLPFAKADWVLEGGAIEHDGSGTVITTEQCLLNPNRNTLTREQVEERLERDLGFERIVWLGSGLLGDHTDGHIDNLARFVAPGRVAIPTAAKDDPNEAVYRDAARRLRSTRLDIVTLPSPGRITGEDGDVIPASYMNFYIGNAAVVVPAIRSGQGPRRRRRGPGAVPGSRCNRPARGPHPHRGRKLPLHFATSRSNSHRNDQAHRRRAAARFYRRHGRQHPRRVRPGARGGVAKAPRSCFRPSCSKAPISAGSRTRACSPTRAAVNEHPAVLAMQELAAELKISIPTSFFEADGPHHYNSLAMVGPDGKVAGVYRKSHIPDGPGYEEKFYFRPGNTGFKVWPGPHSSTLGVGVCWDQWYPETARAMTLMGADILFYPTAIGTEPHDPELDTSRLWRRAMIGHAVRTSCPSSPPTASAPRTASASTATASSATSAATCSRSSARRRPA